MKIGIGGIKFSGELVHISHRALSPSDTSFLDLLRGIAENRINIPFVCSAVYGNEIRNTFCIAVADFASVDRLFQQQVKPQFSTGLSNREQLTIIHRVGTLTLFPHRRDLALLGRIVTILGEAGIVIHSLCTSISALAINIDFHLLELAVEVVGEIVELPENHAPFRPEFCVRQVSP